ncbi:MAG: SDR family oxidoreductase [Ruminococcaceae bacterium]|nr:SDR family oxidoreductase [Oscillospiraceae bacterium]
MKKIVVITGATSGYGLATAKKFKENGDIVIIASRNREKVEKTCRENGFDLGITTDVTNYNDWEILKEMVVKKYGKVDVLVNNAGGGVKIAETVKQEKSDIDKAISLNLNSIIYGCKVFGEVMKNQRDGMVINISSVCAKHRWAGWSVYAAAKAGVLNFTKGFYVEMRPFGVRATCIIPAAASTDFQKNAGIGEENQTLTAEDIANAVFYVANMPKGAVVEEMTIWGISQEVQPL